MSWKMRMAGESQAGLWPFRECLTVSAVHVLLLVGAVLLARFDYYPLATSILFASGPLFVTALTMYLSFRGWARDFAAHWFRGQTCLIAVVVFNVLASGLAHALRPDSEAAAEGMLWVIPLLLIPIMWVSSWALRLMRNFSRG